MLTLDPVSVPKVWVGLTGINQSPDNLLGVGISRVLKVSPTMLEYVTNEGEEVPEMDASYRTPPMALTSLITIPLSAVVEVLTPPAECICGSPWRRATMVWS